MTDVKLKLEAKGIDLSSILEEQEKEFQKAIRGMAMSTYDGIVQQAQDKLDSSRQDYLKSLDFQDLGNIYIISIEDPGVYYEDGFASFDQKDGLLSGPKAKVSQDGKRYNVVPYQHRPFTEKRSPKARAYQIQLKETVASMERISPREIRDRSGRVMGHVVARATKEIEGYTSGMVQIEKNYGKSKSSTYMTFRGVSDVSDPKDWIHPGYRGLKAFEAAEKMIDDRVDQIIEVVFGG